jgi:uncharacterized membrane protein
MGQQRIEVVQEFSLPVDQLFAYLSEHENLSTIFAPAKVTRVRNGDSSRNGVGSVRLVKIPLAPDVEETVTAFKENELVEYRITNTAPIKNHLGVMRFYPFEGGSRLHYTITFEGRLPLIGSVVRAALDFSIRKGLKKIR